MRLEDILCSMAMTVLSKPVCCVFSCGPFGHPADDEQYVLMMNNMIEACKHMLETYHLEIRPAK